MQIPRQIRDAMVAHARFTYPEEACGLLAVDDEGRLRMVYCLTNAEHSPVSYTLEPAEHIKALRHAERMGWRLGGVFHSHTHSGAYPSRTDVARALEPGWLYALVSLVDEDAPEVRAFWIQDGDIDEEALVVHDGEKMESPA